jgi:AraC-like DNA-binding protein
MLDRTLKSNTMTFSNLILDQKTGATSPSPEREGRVHFVVVPPRNGNPAQRNPHREPISHQHCKEAVERHFERDLPYLRVRYSLDDLAETTGIPRHRLSAFFMKEYGVSFPSLLNRYRIAFLEQNLERPDWQRYTLEGIGRECGFNSRNSFIKSVKKFMGKKPSELLRNRED